MRAPFKGVVARTLVKNLETVSPNQEILSFMDIESLEATIDVPASYLARIPQNTPPDRRKAVIRLDGAAGLPVEAKYKEATLLADKTSQTYAVTFSFTPPENMIVLPGMNATIEIRVDNPSDPQLITVPLDAILTDGENTFVWLVDTRTMTVSKRKITTENGIGESVTVIDGYEIFYLSRSEERAARYYKDRYFLYLVPRLKNEFFIEDIIIICNPIVKLFDNNKWEHRVEKYLFKCNNSPI